MGRRLAAEIDVHLHQIALTVRAGEVVVVSGQFLIDSEANLRGALDRLAPGQAP